MTTPTDNLENEWLQLEDELTYRFGKKPTMEAILFLIGVNEYQGRNPKYKFSKEEKQDLMHIAVCKLLGYYGIYEFSHLDEEGWPHYDLNNKIEAPTLEEQDKLLKKAILQYYSQ